MALPSTSASPHVSRWRRLWRTLRFRLAVWNAVVVVLTALVTLLGLRIGVHWALLHEMDQILIEDLQEVSLALSESPGVDLSSLISDLGRKARGHRHHDWFVSLRDAEGNLLWASEKAPGAPVSFDMDDPNLPHTWNGYRIVGQTVKPARHQVALIRVGAALKLLRQDLARIDQLVSLAIVVVLIAAPICGYFLAARAARVVGQITETASRLRPSHLEERLHIRGTGDELDQLATTINGLLDRIAAYLNQKRDFLANAAHELRTPLAAIRSSIEVALNENRSGEEYQELLVDIIDQSAALETLVNQLLLISETEADRDVPASVEFSLADVIRKATEMFQGVADVRRIEFRTSVRDRVFVVGNRQHIRQVLNNLIDNALKYTEPEGKVTLELSFDASTNRGRITITDTGQGISREDLPHVFDRFYRADRSRSRDHEITGTGLGLSICEAVVVAHGGTIKIESELGKGTTVTVELPGKPEPMQNRST